MDDVVDCQLISGKNIYTCYDLTILSHIRLSLEELEITNSPQHCRGTLPAETQQNFVCIQQIL